MTTTTGKHELHLNKVNRRVAKPLRLGPDEPEQGDDYGVATRIQDPELKQPPLYRVILLNDDYTPMEFVVHILEAFFYMSREKATQVMLAVHTQGKGVCGVYTRDIAETRAAMVNQYSRDNEHPLVCEVEKADDQ
ncbi:MAG: ATP-dependent Clp protease adapter ClpS [Saccharospirillum sp.]|uniref:ATP-dependent Clp protease adapter ClpS n=1 Tax=Saccharospirillum sp. TaxID=2033801 RepID=UPI0034A053FE